MTGSGQRDRDGERRWWQRELNLRETLSAFVKAFRAARRHPAGSPIRESSASELARAVRKALVHGPFVVRLGPDGPTLPGDRAGASAVPDDAPADLVLRDADPEALREAVDRWVADTARAEARGTSGGARTEG